MKNVIDMTTYYVYNARELASRLEAYLFDDEKDFVFAIVGTKVHDKDRIYHLHFNEECELELTIHDSNTFKPKGEGMTFDNMKDIYNMICHDHELK
jgi:hypothetical protein